MTYTIETALATGKSDPTFGTEYHVKLQDTPGTFTMWFKKEPAPGQSLDGDIEQGKYGPKFKKAKKEWNGSTNSQNGHGQQDAPKSFSGKSTYKDNSDGMRQGMCINNAASYVATIPFENALTDQEWAETVYSYACALYAKGDLVASTPIEEAPANVREMFGN